jgi:hypothetical protein
MIVNARNAIRANFAAELPAAGLTQSLDINTAIAWPNCAQEDWTAYLAVAARHHPSKRRTSARRRHYGSQPLLGAVPSGAIADALAEEHLLGVVLGPLRVCSAGTPNRASYRR